MKNFPVVADLASRYEESNKEYVILEPSVRQVTFLMQGHNHALLESISDYYGSTKTAVLNDLLDASLQEFFVALPMNVRLELSQRADAKVGNDGPGYWSHVLEINK